jgi:phosphohistidine phosphatase
MRYDTANKHQGAVYGADSLRLYCQAGEWVPKEMESVQGMKQLYLIRHAKSSWKDPDLTDMERPLNKRGKHDAPFMGERLSRYNVQPDLIISSPANRALSTAKLIAKEIGYPNKRIAANESAYLAGVQALLTIIRGIDASYSRVMLFGHNPGLTELAVYLSKHQVENIPTCGVFCIDFHVDSWRDVSEGNGIFAFFDYPKKHQ